MEEGGPDLFAKRVGVHLGAIMMVMMIMTMMVIIIMLVAPICLMSVCGHSVCENIDLVRNGGDKSVGPVATSEVEIAAIH